MTSIPRNATGTEARLLSVLLDSDELARYDVVQPEKPLRGCQYAFAKGAFGLVFLAVDKQHAQREQVVLKVEASTIDGGVIASLEREYLRLQDAIQMSSSMPVTVPARRSHLPTFVRLHRNIQSRATSITTGMTEHHPASMSVTVLVLPYYPETVTHFLHRHGMSSTMDVTRPLFARLATECIEALAELHATGHVHQDVKFDNMMVDRQRNQNNFNSSLLDSDQLHIILIDFGTTDRAKQMIIDRRSTKRSRHGVGFDGVGPLRRGTDAFASPCSYQLDCTASYIDDLIALGFCLWSICTTRLPWMTRQYTSSDIGRMKLQFLQSTLELDQDCPSNIHAYLISCFQQERSPTNLPNYNSLLNLLLLLQVPIDGVAETPRRRRSMLNPSLMQTPMSNKKTTLMTEQLMTTPRLLRTPASQRVTSTKKKKTRLNNTPSTRKLNFALTNAVNVKDMSKVHENGTSLAFPDLPPPSSLTVAQLKDVLSSNGVTLTDQRNLRRHNYVSLYDKYRNATLLTRGRNTIE